VKHRHECAVRTRGDAPAGKRPGDSTEGRRQKAALAPESDAEQEQRLVQRGAPERTRKSASEFTHVGSALMSDGIVVCFGPQDRTAQAA
jgi:hypothetical protein